MSSKTEPPSIDRFTSIQNNEELDRNTRVVGIQRLPPLPGCGFNSQSQISRLNKPDCMSKTKRCQNKRKQTSKSKALSNLKYVPTLQVGFFALSYSGDFFPPPVNYPYSILKPNAQFSLTTETRQHILQKMQSRIFEEKKKREGVLI